MATPAPNLSLDAQHGPELLPQSDADYHTRTKDARDQRNRRDAKTWIMEIFADIAEPTGSFYHERVRRVLKYIENRLFLPGEQYIGFNWNNWEYSNLQYSSKWTYAEEMLLMINNRILPAYRAILKEIVASSPVYNAKPRNQTDPLPETVAACRVIQDYIDFDRDRNEQPSLRQEAAGYQTQCGNVFMETWYDADAGGAVELPDWDDVVNPGDEIYQCADCGAAGQFSSLAQNGQAPPVADVQGTPMIGQNCPNCGGGPLVYNQAAPSMSQQPKMDQNGQPVMQKKTVGVPVRRHRDPIGIIVDYAKKSIRDSTFLYEESSVNRHELEAAYKDFTIPSSPLSNCLRALLALERSAGANSIPGAVFLSNEFRYGSPFEQIRFERLWLDYPVYCNVTLDKDLNIGPSGSPGSLTIQAGTCLGDIFDKGMRVYKIGDQIVNIANESKNDRWAHYPWVKSVNSFWGLDMISPLVQPQKVYNELYSLEVQNNMANATQTLLYDRNAVDISQWTGSPVWNTIAVNQRVDGEWKGRVYDVIPSLPINQQVTLQKDHLAADIEYIAGAQPIPHDSQEQQVKTATEAAISRDMQVGIIGPSMALRAEGEITAIRQGLKLCQQHPSYPLLKGRYKDYEMKSFLNCDLEQDIEISYAEGSHIPRTTQDQRINLLTLATFANVPGGIFNAQAFPDPDFRTAVIELFGNPCNLDKPFPDRRNAEIRLQILGQIVTTQVAKVTDINQPPPPPQINTPQGPQPNPQAFVYQQMIQRVLGELPSNPFDDTGVLMKVYIDWTKTDAADKASPFLKQCVYALIGQCQQEQQQTQEQAQQAAAQAQMQQGLMEAAPRLMEIGLKGDQEIEKAKVLHGAESAELAQQHVHDMQQQAQDQAHQAGMQQADQDHEAGLQQLQQAHEKDMQQTDIDNQPPPASGGS